VATMSWNILMPFASPRLMTTVVYHSSALDSIPSLALHFGSGQVFVVLRQIFFLNSVGL